jgi:hypothetical protein
MTTPAPMSTGRERAVTYLPSDLGQRLRTWAALLGLPTSHLLAQVITEATPSRDQLAEMVQASAAAAAGDILQPPGAAIRTNAVPGPAPQAITAGSDVRALLQPSPSPALWRGGPPRALRTPAAALRPKT